MHIPAHVRRNNEEVQKTQEKQGELKNMGWFLTPLISDTISAAYCKRECQHKDCIEVRERMKKLCSFCGKGFSQEKRECVYLDDEHNYVHAHCVEVKA